MEAPSKAFLLFFLLPDCWIISKVEWNVVSQTFFAPYLLHRSRNNRRDKLRSKFWREKMFRKPHLKLLRWFSVHGTNNNCVLRIVSLILTCCFYLYWISGQKLEIAYWLALAPDNYKSDRTWRSMIMFRSRHCCRWQSLKINNTSNKVASMKGPVKLIQWVKIAHSFLQSVSNLFHSIILSLPM